MGWTGRMGWKVKDDLSHPAYPARPALSIAPAASRMITS
jgi:hypothetical protein